MIRIRLTGDDAEEMAEFAADLDYLDDWDVELDEGAAGFVLVAERHEYIPCSNPNVFIPERRAGEKHIIWPR